MRTTIGLSRRQVGATRRVETFCAVSRTFVSSGVPERALGGRGWPGLAGWMKAQIQVKTRNRGRDWAIFRRPNKKRLSGASSGSWLEMLLLISYVRSVSFYSVLERASRCERLVEG
jgi:hypothetical protein